MLGLLDLATHRPIHVVQKDTVLTWVSKELSTTEPSGYLTRAKVAQGEAESLQRHMAMSHCREGLATTTGGFLILPVPLAKFGEDSDFKTKLRGSKFALLELRSIFDCKDITAFSTATVESTCIVIMDITKIILKPSHRLRTILPTVNWPRLRPTPIPIPLYRLAPANAADSFSPESLTATSSSYGLEDLPLQGPTAAATPTVSRVSHVLSISSRSFMNPK